MIEMNPEPMQEKIDCAELVDAWNDIAEQRVAKLNRLVEEHGSLEDQIRFDLLVRSAKEAIATLSRAPEAVAWRSRQSDPLAGWHLSVNRPKPQAGFIDEPLYVTTPAPQPIGSDTWQTMDSAPKDGSRVELWHGSTNVRDGGWPVHGAWREYKSGEWSWRDDHGQLLNPTAWKPSAARPKAGSDSDA